MYGDTPAITTMRTTPTSVDFGTPLRLISYNEGSIVNITNITLQGLGSSADSFGTNLIVASGLTSNLAYRLQANNSTSAFIGFSAEL